MSRGKRALLGLGITLVSLLLLVFAFLVLFVNFVDQYELGYKFDRRTGKIELLDRTGFIVTPPILVKVHAIDLRPGQVCMNANARVLNCKLVKFDPTGFDTFIAWHGRGAGGSVGGPGIYEILKSYAFNVNEGRDCPFLVVLDDMRRKDGSATATPSPEQT